MIREQQDMKKEYLSRRIKESLADLDTLNAKPQPLNDFDETKKSILIKRAKTDLTRDDLSNHLTAEEIAKVEAL